MINSVICEFHLNKKEIHKTMLHIAFCLGDELLLQTCKQFGAHLLILAMKQGFGCNLQPNLRHEQVSVSKWESILTLLMTSLGAKIMGCGNTGL